MLLVFSFSVVVVIESLMMVVEDRNRMNSSKIFSNSISFRLSSKIIFNFFVIIFYLFTKQVYIGLASTWLISCCFMIFFFMFGIDGRFYR